MKNTVRVNFDFPADKYPFLKMLCAKKRVSLKDFATKLLIKALDEEEDELLVRRAEERLQNLKDEDLIPWDEAMRLAEWG